MAKEKTLTSKEKFMVGIIVFGGFVTILNQTVMSPALPAIMEDLNITAATGQWLTSVFLLVNGLMIPITAYLIGRFSTRQLFFAAMTAFTVGSTLAAFSTGFPMLVAGRVIQAIGAGIQLPFVSVMLMLIFPKSKRGFALGISGIVIGAAPAIGPTLAGLLVDQLGWRYIFACIAPFAAATLIFAIIFLKNFDTKQESHLDWLSVIFSTVGFGGLLFGFSCAGSAGWLSPKTYATIIIGAVFIVLFIRRQFRLDIPLLDLRVLKNKVFAVSTVLTMVISSSLTVAAVLTPIFLQNVLGNSAMHSGLILMPGAILMAALSPVSGTLFDKFGPRTLAIVGITVIMIGTFMLSIIDHYTTSKFILIAYTFRMAGISLVNMPLNTWGINALERDKIAHGNAVNNSARQVAGSIGTAVFITVMMVAQSTSMNIGVAAVSDGIDAAFRGATLMTAIALVITVVKVGSVGSIGKPQLPFEK
ncbi:MAG: DHA2 family efflux MFS transporter permease subunit [Clostridiales Family XIII bacterium]|jgi:EmrB/QacA subfamily drug resistance transporter|nr:DHA2 family efflux MFS transporter permease subunit [Clostridiales Family XIII bacterium]